MHLFILIHFVGPPQLPNPHVFICGTSGGGKSVALKTLAARNIATTGCGAFFIDVEGEYSNLTKMLGGKVIKIVQGESAGINPFELEPDTKGNKPRTDDFISRYYPDICKVKKYKPFIFQVPFLNF